LWSRYDDPDYDPSFDPDFDPDSYAEPEEVVVERRDPVVDLAKEDLRNLFAKEPESVFYQRQLQVIFEKKYFHWITSHSLSELAREGFRQRCCRYLEQGLQREPSRSIGQPLIATGKGRLMRL
jgi:hypothetical protein